MLSMMATTTVAMLAAALGPIGVASSPETAAAAAYHDAIKIPPKDAYYMRYLWWDPSWQRYVLLTKVTQSLISLERDFPNPVRVCPGLVRIDLRESGHQKFLHVWENFRKIDFVFHNKKKYFKDANYLTYYPGGYYGTTITKDVKSENSRAWYDASVSDVKIKAGQVNDEVALWANPPVEIKPGLVGEAQNELRRLLHTEVPILWGPFWMVRVQRQIDINNTVNGVGYYEWFGIKKRDDYFKILAVNEKDYIDRLMELRAYVKDSGVSEQSRQIVVLAERVWGTLDVFTQKDPVDDEKLRGSPALNLRRGELRHNAERWIGRKADGLWLNGLFAATGEVQETAPDKIGPDTSTLNPTRDKRIGPDTCIHCHGTLKRHYIIDFDDWLRKNVTRARMVLRGKDREEELELTAYLRSITLVVKQNREAYADAVARLTRDDSNPKDPGMTFDEFTKWYRENYYQYVAPKGGVTREIAARYLGTNLESFVAGIEALNKDRGAVDPITASYLGKTPEGVPTLDMENNYQYWQSVARGIRNPELLIRVRGFDSGGSKP